MFDELHQWLHQQVTQSDVFAGIVGGSIVVSFLYLLRAVPRALFDLTLSQTTVVARINSEDEAFNWVCEWMAVQPYARRARRLNVSSKHQARGSAEEIIQDRESHWTVSPGEGNHLMWFRRRPVWVNRSFRENPGGAVGGAQIKEAVELRMPGRSQRLLWQVLDEMRMLKVGDERVVVKVYDGYWRTAASKVPRQPDSIVLKDGQLPDLLSDADWFFGAADWYAQRGVPWRRGYLFSGIPGTGKSTLAFVLASHFKRPLCVLNLGSLDGDSGLMGALAAMPRNGILLIEDVDAANNFDGAARRRRNPGAPRSTSKDKDEANPLTLSAFLNALDGVASVDGRLLVMTTNHPESLDPALVRPGRVDRHEVIEPLDTEGAKRLFLRFFPGQHELAQGIRLSAPVPASSLQEAFVRHRDSAWDAVRSVSDL